MADPVSSGTSNRIKTGVRNCSAGNRASRFEAGLAETVLVCGFDRSGSEVTFQWCCGMIQTRRKFEH
jgi:hypothetical protein